METGSRIILMTEAPLRGKTVLVTGAARRLGRVFALACAQAGADIVIHHGHSETDAASLASEISGLNRRAFIFQADLSDSSSIDNLMQLIKGSTPLHCLINSAAIFESLTLDSTSLEDWNKHLGVN